MGAILFFLENFIYPIIINFATLLNKTNPIYTYNFFASCFLFFWHLIVDILYFCSNQYVSFQYQSSHLQSISKLTFTTYQFFTFYKKCPWGDTCMEPLECNNFNMSIYNKALSLVLQVDGFRIHTTSFEHQRTLHATKHSISQNEAKECNDNHNTCMQA
jgi:hypothetical protein